MKLRIQDNSVRFRLTLRELEQLAKDRRILATTQVPGGSATFSYGLEIAAQLTESAINIEPYSVLLRLSPADFGTLSDDSNEGVYIRREWQDEHGAICRFIAFAEKDRPGSACEKPEAWVYEEIPGHHREVRPIPSPERKPA